ncbi:hypothetical protein C4587_02870 [Candidatus Parcubacteria bacterium]|nr:MAG: hypothetical protein C4587_02870 [Candidatus Parcubacteria bacterium]
MRKLFGITLFLSGLFLAHGLAFATDFSSTNFIVKDPVVKPGGGFSTSTSFQLHTSISQEAIGISSSTTFGLRAGFLFFPAPSTSTTPTSTPSGGGSGSGGAGGGTGVSNVVLGLSQELPTGTAAGDLPIPSLPSCPLWGDFNCSGGVGFTDLSILLYYFNQPRELALGYDLNGDGVLDAADISVLFYYWDERVA